MSTSNSIELPCIELSDEELSAVSAGKLDFGDIKGESTNSGHNEWIEILSFNHSVTAPSR
jgi:Type VI secretion system effector, Hcp